MEVTWARGSPVGSAAQAGGSSQSEQSHSRDGQIFSPSSSCYRLSCRWHCAPIASSLLLLQECLSPERRAAKTPGRTKLDPCTLVLTSLVPHTVSLVWSPAHNQSEWQHMTRSAQSVSVGLMLLLFTMCFRRWCGIRRWLQQVSKAQHLLRLSHSVTYYYQILVIRNDTTG